MAEEFEFKEKKKLEKVREKLERLLNTRDAEEIFVRNIRKLLHDE